MPVITILKAANRKPGSRSISGRIPARSQRIGRHAAERWTPDKIIVWVMIGARYRLALSWCWKFKEDVLLVAVDEIVSCEIFDWYTTQTHVPHWIHCWNVFQILRIIRAWIGLLEKTGQFNQINTWLYAWQVSLVCDNLTTHHSGCSCRLSIATAYDVLQDSIKLCVDLIREGQPLYVDLHFFPILPTYRHVLECKTGKNFELGEVTWWLSRQGSELIEVWTSGFESLQRRTSFMISSDSPDA